MKTSLPFLDAATGAPSPCGAPLDIEVSSTGLGWRGVTVEKGWSPYFHPVNVLTPTFYFALACDATVQGKILLGDEALDLKMEPGEIWMNPPHSAFSQRVDAPCFFVILSIAPERLFAAYRGQRRFSGAHFLTDSSLEDRTLSSLMWLFLAHAESRGSDDTPFFEHILAALATHFIDEYSSARGVAAIEAEGARQAIDAAAVERVRRYVMDRLDRQIPIGDLASELGMSRFWFLKSFKRVTGTTPYQFVLDVKVEAARPLLLHTTRSLSNIALSLGFSDQSHFSRVFKRSTGVSPGQFRRG